MDTFQDSLLVILLVAIVVNTAIISLVVASSRTRRARRVAALDGVLATSFMDRSARSTWTDPATGGAMPAEEVVAAEGVIAAEEPVGGSGSAGSAGSAESPESAPLGARDPLTHLLDAAAFGHVLADEEARVARYHRPATVVVFELDGLDRLVDRLGPEAGDRVVPALADTIHRLARRADHVARLSPSRFAVLLPETDEVAAINYVERVRAACELWLESGAIAMRLAIGWAGTSGDLPLTLAMRTATERMLVEHRRNVRRGEGSLAAVPGPGAEAPSRPGSEPASRPVEAEERAAS